MTPRSLLLSAAALALAACNSGQPRIYRVAIDLTASVDIKDGTCFKSGMAPNRSVTETLTNLYSEEQWIVWDSVASDTDPTPKEFLDLGQQKFKLGDSPAIDFNDTIGTTTPGVFTGRRSISTTVGGSYVEIRQTTITAKFSDLGAAPSGTLSLEAEYACVPQNGGVCPLTDFVPDPKKCTADLPFSARRIDVSRISGYTEEPKGP